MQRRQKRLAELTTLQTTAIHNQVYPLQKVDYGREVTEASNQYFVLVHLSSPSGGANPESRILSEIWRQAAAKFGDIKFCEIRADMCIEGYPERNTPTVLVYKDGEIRRQLVTLKEVGGVRTKLAGGFPFLSFWGIRMVTNAIDRYRANASWFRSAERKWRPFEEEIRLGRGGQQGWRI